MKAEQLLLEKLRVLIRDHVKGNERVADFERRKYREYQRWSEQVEIYLLTKTEVSE